MGSSKSKIQPEGSFRYFYRDHFLLTNDKSYLQPQVVNDAFRSDLMWWNDALEPKQMQRLLDSSLTFGIYAVPETKEEMMKNGPPRRTVGHDLKMVGFARLVTDYVTIAYLTDVFVLENYQRRGLARWMMDAVKQVIDEWPMLRGLMLMAQNRAAAKMYEETLGAVDFDQGPSKGMVFLEMAGKGEKAVPLDH